MVGKFSDETKMSGSRIGTLYCWKYADGHPFQTPNDELRRSIAAKHGESTLTDIGEPGAVGNLLEEILIQDTAERLGLEVPCTNPAMLIERNEYYEASLDGLCAQLEPVTVRASEYVQILDLERENPVVDEIELSGMIPIECKCTSAFPDGPPPLYRGPIQLHMQMMASNANFGIIVSLHRSIERRITIYKCSPTVCERIIELCKDFVERVESETFYPPVSVDDAAANVPGELGQQCDLGDLDDDIARLESLRSERDAISESIAETELQIMKAMGEAQHGDSARYAVEWPVRNYKAQPEKVTPAKDARSVRLKSLKIKPKI
jgi:hypothetical protein